MAAAPWHRGRRQRYAERAHQIETRRASAPVTVVPEHTAWKLRLGETEAHAYSSGPGWMRSVCRAERWTVTLVDPHDAVDAEITFCSDCALLVNGAPGETERDRPIVTEAELRLLERNR